MPVVPPSELAELTRDVEETIEALGGLGDFATLHGRVGTLEKQVQELREGLSRSQIREAVAISVSALSFVLAVIAFIAH